MKGIKLIALTIASFSFSTSAMSGILLPTAWYLEGNVGISKPSSVDYGTGSSATTTGPGFSVIGGYKFMPFFAAEVGYTKYADAKIKNSSDVEAGKDKHYALDIAGKGILPITNTCVSLFAKLGVSQIRSSVSISNQAAASSIGLSSGSHKATGVYIGTGADYSVTPNFPINIQWARSVGSSTTGNLDLYSIGIAYLFG